MVKMFFQKFMKPNNQVIQVAVTELGSPNVGGHQQPFKGSLFHHPNKVTFSRWNAFSSRQFFSRPVPAGWSPQNGGEK